MFDKIYDKVLKFIKNNLGFLFGLLAAYLFFSYPMDYYIFTGGGISDISSRISVSDNNKIKGSYNLSYVSELNGNLLTYLLSYVMPGWEREKLDDYKYNESDDLEDLEFRSQLQLDEANANAVKVAYNLAGREYRLIKSRFYIISKYDKYKSDLEVQDEILSIDNKTFSNLNSMRKYIQTSTSDYLDVLVKRDGKNKHIKAKTYKVGDVKIFGILINEKDEYEVSPKVKFKFKNNESGPSAGLITTLYIYDKLVKEDITGGLKIAGTGTIDSDGNVGEIGGVKYKLLGAAEDKADIFFVPSGNYKEALKVKKKNKLRIKLVKVKTINDAVDALKSLK